ncbi:MAG TPA: hypothetical protein VGO35_10775 [Gammaproteobacteria bacterium]|jgi:hypothetical protein|nr:hypothetical protein [Gammaproteobacteria bacterium]
MKRLLIAVSAFAVILAGCASAGGGSSGITVLQAGGHSAMKDQVYKDLHSQADLDAFLATAFDKGSAPSLQVDWTKQMVLVAFIGIQKQSGYRVSFTKVDDSSPDAVQVSLKVTIPCSKESRPGENQSPYQIVTVPATTKVVNYAEPVQDYLKC